MVETYKTIPAQEKPHRGQKRGNRTRGGKPAAIEKEKRSNDG